MLLYLIVIPLLAFLVYFFGKWKIRKMMLKNMAQNMGLGFECDKDNVKIEGIYKNKNISIIDKKIIMATGDGFVSAKMININVDGKAIYDYEGEVIFPLPKKIKKIIDNFIEKGVIPAKNIKLGWIVVGILWTLLIISQIIMYTWFHN